MSSIDKDMQNIACEYDRRVRVRNTSTCTGINGCNGYIKFYIGDECILTIKDRYGYIHDDEKEAIRQAIINYKNNERQREAAERRRLEEEERQRRLEEEKRKEVERIAAFNSAVSAVTKIKREVECAFAVLKDTSHKLHERVSSILKKLASARFNTDAICAQLQSIDKKNESCLNAATASYNNKLESISRQYEMIRDNLNIEQYTQIEQKVKSIDSKLPVSLDFKSIDDIESLAQDLMALQEKLFELRKQFENDKDLSGISGEVAKISLRQIDEVDTCSVKQITSLITKLEDARKRIEQSKNEMEIQSIIDDLTNVKPLEQIESPFVPQQSTYCGVDYQSLCNERVELLRQLYEDLKNKKHTTATQSELEYIERTLQEFSVGMMGRNLLESIKEMIWLVRIINTDDYLFKDIFKDYDDIAEKLAEVGVVAEQLDVVNYSIQRERLLKLLIDELAKKELQNKKEEIEDNRNMLAFGLRNAFASQGLYFVTGKVSQDGLVEENVFVMPGVDDVVVKAIISEDSIHWFICGTEKEDGTAVTAERVLEIMREFDYSGKPQAILNALTQFLQIQNGDITCAIDSTSENAIEQIVENGTFSFAQQLQSEDGKVFTVRQILESISQEFPQEAAQNKQLYESKDTNGSTEIAKNSGVRLVEAASRVIQRMQQSIYESNHRPNQQTHQMNANRARYMGWR